MSSATLHQPVGVVREGAQIHSGHDMMSSRAVTGHVIYPFRDVTRSTYPKSCTVEQTVLLGFRPPLLRVTGSSGTAAGAAARLGGSQAVVPCGALWCLVVLQRVALAGAITRQRSLRSSSPSPSACRRAPREMKRSLTSFTGQSRVGLSAHVSSFRSLACNVCFESQGGSGVAGGFESFAGREQCGILVAVGRSERADHCLLCLG